MIQTGVNQVAQINLLSVNLIAQLKVYKNYLFGDCHLKSGIETWISSLRTTGRNPRLNE